MAATIPVIDECDPPKPDPSDFDAPPRREAGYPDLFLEITWDRVDGVSGTLGMENFRFPFQATHDQAKDLAMAVEADPHFAVFACARHASAGLHVLVVRATVFRSRHGEKFCPVRYENVDARDGFTVDGIHCSSTALPHLLQSGLDIARAHASAALATVLRGLESGDIIPLEKETTDAK